MSKPLELIPVGIDLGSLHARVAIGSLNHADSPAAVDTDGSRVVDSRPLPNVISNAQGSRYTLALVGTDGAGSTEQTGESGEKSKSDESSRHIFGEAARRTLAREKRPTITKDPSSMVRELVRSSSSVVNNVDDAVAEEKAEKAAAFFSHLADLACDASSAHPSKLRAVVSVPVSSSSEEQSGIVGAVERGISEALAARMSTKEAKKLKKKKGESEDEPSVVAVITDPAAVCIAHGLTEIEHPGVVDLAASRNETCPNWTNALVVDWGASGLTATHIARASTNSSLLTIVRHITDATCSGTAIVTALANHCASMFERKSRVSGVMESKKACHRLEMACESAVRTLSRAPTVTVAVDGLYEGIDMNVPISRPRFDMLISGVMRKAEALLQTFAGEEQVNFDVVLLAGNVCEMPSASNLVRTKLFPNAHAGRGDFPPDEAVAIGCARYAASVLSCDTHSRRGGIWADDDAIGPATRKVKACPLTIGICRIPSDKVNGHLEEVITNSAIPLIENGEPLPANVTRKIMCSNGGENSSDSYIAIVQMKGGAAKKSKVIGKIEKIPLDDKSFEITMELSSSGKLTISVNGGPQAAL